MKKDAVSITDRRTDKVYEIPVKNGTIPAMALREIKVDQDDFGLMTYDPAFQNTAFCKSRITYIDGEDGILRYRGYPIEELAGKCSFLEIIYLLVHGELPTSSQLEQWTRDTDMEAGKGGARVGGRFGVRLATLDDQRTALEYYDRLRSAGYPAEIQPTREGLYHVRIRQLASREDAEALAESLRGKHGVAEPLVTQ